MSGSEQPSHSNPDTTDDQGSPHSQIERPAFLFCKKCGTRHPENTYRCVNCEDLLHPVPSQKPTVIVREGGLSMILPKNNPYSLWAYYCGVFAFTPILGVPLAIIAIATGVMGIHRFKTDDEAKGMLHASAGLLLGLLAIILHIILFKFIDHLDWDFYRSLVQGEIGSIS